MDIHRQERQKHQDGRQKQVECWTYCKGIGSITEPFGHTAGHLERADVAKLVLKAGGSFWRYKELGYCKKGTALGKYLGTQGTGKKDLRIVFLHTWTAPSLIIYSKCQHQTALIQPRQEHLSQRRIKHSDPLFCLKFLLLSTFHQSKLSLWRKPAELWLCYHRCQSRPARRLWRCRGMVSVYLVQPSRSYRQSLCLPTDQLSSRHSIRAWYLEPVHGANRAPSACPDQAGHSVSLRFPWRLAYKSLR